LIVRGIQIGDYMSFKVQGGKSEEEGWRKGGIKSEGRNDARVSA